MNTTLPKLQRRPSPVYSIRKVSLHTLPKLMLIPLVISLCIWSATTSAQITVGLKAGISPDVRPGTAHCIVNRLQPENEFLFNSVVVKYSPVVGAVVRLDRNPFWFSAEFLYYGWTETYSIQYLADRRPDSDTYSKEKNYVVEVPVSIGVSLGKVEIFSGFSPRQIVSHDTELDQIDGYSSKLPKRYMGWHSGVGINLHNVLIDLRYTQAFANYGEHRFINDQELTLGNAPGRVTSTIALRF